MEKEAFRQRMQQYKQAREQNPQLKYWDWKRENDLGYQLYKNNLPSNLQVETDDYDLYGAYESNMQPTLEDDGYHLGSRDPYTGRILKSKNHPTYRRAIEAEIQAGYFPYERDGQTYTKTYSPVDISGYVDGTDGVGNYITNQINTIRANALSKSKTRRKPAVPLIGGTPNPQTAQQFDAERKAKLQQYQKEINNIESQGIYNFSTGQRDIPMHLQRQYDVAKKSYDLWSNMTYQPTVGGAIGPSCIYTATDNYGSQYLQPSNVEFMSQPASVSGFTKIDNTQVQPGDIVIRTEGDRNHVMIYAGRDKNGPLYNHSNGGTEESDYRVNARYPARQDQLSTYRFTGTHNDSINWRKQYNGYATGGTIDEDPPQYTSEIPIRNFDPKGDPYNPEYGYNPGAGYVSGVDPIAAMYIGDVALNPITGKIGSFITPYVRKATKVIKDLFTKSIDKSLKTTNQPIYPQLSNKQQRKVDETIAQQLQGYREYLQSPVVQKKLNKPFKISDDATHSAIEDYGQPIQDFITKSETTINKPYGDFNIVFDEIPTSANVVAGVPINPNAHDFSVYNNYVLNAIGGKETSAIADVMQHEASHWIERSVPQNFISKYNTALADKNNLKNFDEWFKGMVESNNLSKYVIPDGIEYSQLGREGKRLIQDEAQQYYNYITRPTEIHSYLGQISRNNFKKTSGADLFPYENYDDLIKDVEYMHPIIKDILNIYKDKDKAFNNLKKLLWTSPSLLMLDNDKSN